MDRFKQHPAPQFLINESVVLIVIMINTLVLWLDAFPTINKATNNVLDSVDYLCLLYFILEALLKIWIFTFREYWQSGWNKIDFLIVIMGLPLLISPFYHAADLEAFSFVLILRQARFLRFWRMMRFIPHAPHIWAGVARSLRASFGVFLVLLGLNLILAMGANMLFRDVAPEYFGDPLRATYSMFKVFTIEGWYEIPDLLAEQGLSGSTVLALRLYFSVAVLSGGILGLSLANAVFVEEMMADNTDHLEMMIIELREELQQVRQEAQQGQEQQLAAIQAAFNELQQEMTRLRLPD